jgi:hypothetical protein
MIPLCKRGCTTPFEHKLHVWEPILSNPTFQREAIALTKKILRPVVRILDTFSRAPSVSPAPAPAVYTESFGTTGERAGD